MLHYTVTNQLCLAPCAVKCLVSESVTSAIPNFFICFSKISNFGTALNFQVFHILTSYNTTNIAFFCFFRKVVTFYIRRKSVGKLTVIHISTVPLNSVQVSFTIKSFLCGFKLFWRTKWVFVNFAVSKNYRLPKNF